jgi:serine protease Do
MELRRVLGIMKPGSVVGLSINRRGKSIDLRAHLTEMNPVAVGAPPDRPDTNDTKASNSAKTWGMAVAPLTDVERQVIRGSGGVRITAVAAGAEAVGLKVGDVILAVDASDVLDLKQFDAAVAKMDKTRALPLTVLRGDWAQFLRVPVMK